jgi:hypothetical protein
MATPYRSRPKVMPVARTPDPAVRTVPMSERGVLAGVGAAVPTLRREDGTVDAEAHRRLAAHLAADGAALVLVAGTTGGGSRVTHPERLVLTTASTVLPVVVGVPEAVTDPELHDLADAGAAAVLVAFDPAGGVASALSLAERSEAAGVRLVGYHHPSHHPAMPPGWYGPLAAAGVPVKNSDPDPAVLEAMLAAGLSVFVGATSRLGDVASGPVGVLSGVASVRFGDVAKAAVGDGESQARLLEWESSVSDRIGAITAAARVLVG